MGFVLIAFVLGQVSRCNVSPVFATANMRLVWTPLISATMTTEAMENFSGTPMGRPGQPSEVATCFVFLASQDSSFISGQSLHPNGGVVVNG